MKEWIAGRHYIPFDDYDDPDAHSPLAALDPPKRIGPATWITLLATGALLAGVLVRAYG